MGTSSSYWTLVTILALGLAGCAASQPQRGQIRTSADPLACTRMEQAAASPVSADHDLEVTLLHEEDIAGASDDDEPALGYAVGVQLSFAAREGVTRPWLERRIACYRHLSSAVAHDPMLVAGSRFSVHSAGGRFHVRVFGDSAAVAHQIVAAAEGMQASNSQPLAAR
jgi:hypothetical protein